MKMEDGGAGNKKLLVAGGDKRYGKVCRRVRSMPEDEKQNRGTGREVEVE